MKTKLAFLFCAFACAIDCTAYAAVAVKKAAPVAPKESATSSTTASLVPTVLGLVSGVQALNAKQNALTAECIPSSQEISFVDNIVKEWAKTGAASATEVETLLKRKRCSSASNGYAQSVQIAAATESGDVCYNYFAGTGNDGMIWAGYPRVGSASYCTDGAMTCAEKNKKQVSDIYEIFNLVDFTEKDYTPQEATMAAKLIAKIENCSSAKLSAKKRALWGEFLTSTISGVGQKTNTGTIMQTVGGIAGSGGGGLGGLSSLGAIAGQFMDK